MLTEAYTAKGIIDLISWVHRDPERAVDTAMKLIAMSAVLVIIAACAQALSE